jgi:hypothetical protein
MTKQWLHAWIGLGILISAFASWAQTSAEATPGWLSPEKLEATDAYTEPTIAVAMSPSGDVTAVWVQSNGESHVIDAAWRSAGGTFSTPVQVSPPNATASHPVIAVDAQGDTLAAWQAIVSGHGFPIVESAWRPAGKAFRQPVIFSKTQWDEAPAIAMDSRGDATVAWQHYNGQVNLLEAASCPPGVEFGPPVELTIEEEGPDEFQNSGPPVITMNSRGDTAVAWKSNKRSTGQSSPHGPYNIQVATKPAGGVFGQRINLPEELDGSPSIAMDALGDTTVVWGDPNASSTTIKASTRTAPSANFDKPVTIDESLDLKNPPEIAMDEAGNAIVAWAAESISTSTRLIGGSFGDPIILNPGTNNIQPSLAINDEGDGVMAWVEREALGNFIKASTKQTINAFGNPTYLSTTSLYTLGGYISKVSVAMDAQGDAVGAWMSSDGSNAVPEVAGYQAVGPRLTALKAPTEGQVGASLAFSVSPLSVWSTVVSTTWSWDDGSPETSGTSVTHLFDTPGTHHVSVSATDTLGNLTTATRTVTIKSPPTGPPTKTQEPPRQPKPKVVVATFTPLFATRASTGGNKLGLLVRIAAVIGARHGDTLVVRCIAGCQHALRKTVRVRHSNVHSAIAITPPLVLRRSTRIEIELLAPGHIARYVQYRFIRTRRGVIAYVTHRGCLSPTGVHEICS